jgi:hypothetical protein
MVRQFQIFCINVLRNFPSTLTLFLFVGSNKTNEVRSTKCQAKLSLLISICHNHKKLGLTFGFWSTADPTKKTYSISLNIGLFKVNLELPFSGLTWKMKYQFVLETGN